MFENLFRNKNNTREIKTKENLTHGEDIPLVCIEHKTVPFTIEMRRRKMEERIRKQYNIKKTKEAKLM